MTSATPGQVWNEATVAGALEAARRFDSTWKRSAPGRRPDLLDHLSASGSTQARLLLALLRVDLTHRRAVGEFVGPEWYLDRIPELPDDVLVALLYEEFCLREEAGERPDPAEYFERFPSLADRLREIFEIHDLVIADVSPDGREHPAFAIEFPKVGQTIAGFRLVEELGQGSFARVFLARERRLADRLVALKVSRSGSREPQTLAKLQHTNIVPVYSYRTDPKTRLHLLCMPFFGRITLVKVLEDPKLRTARSGLDLVEALDRLGLGDATDPKPNRREALDALKKRTYSRAVAWWGARIADALRHAHDRGVLHRDVKPSNILIGGDGMPMLLDFNLARESSTDGDPSAKFGGTLASMAPEHIKALVEGDETKVDHRADLYSLGMVIREMLGSKPARNFDGGAGPAWLLDTRRDPFPSFSEGAPPVPPAFRAVVRRCLASDPALRFASAGELAVDLQAIADDAPLTFTREPFPSRLARWLRRNVIALSVTSTVAVLVLLFVSAQFQAQTRLFREEADALGLFRAGIRSTETGDSRAAEIQFALAAARTEGRPDLWAIRAEALAHRAIAEQTSRGRDQADALFARAENLRFALLGFVGDRAAASHDLLEALAPLGVLASAHWMDSRELRRLDEGKRSRLLREVDDLLFFWIVAAAIAPSDPSKSSTAVAEQAENAVAYCDLALAFSKQEDSWQALRRWWRDQPQDRPAAPRLPELSSTDSSATCFRWYLLGKLGSDRRPALTWLERATRLEPENYWHQFTLGFEQARGISDASALTHYDIAVALRPDLPWAWKNRALVSQRLGNWAASLDDLKRSLKSCRNPLDAARVRIELGRARQRIGDFRAARLDYAAVIANDPGGVITRDARRDLARLEADSGTIRQALNLYDDLIAGDPRDWRSRWGRAKLGLRRGDLASAEQDLDFLVRTEPNAFEPQFLADRAVAHLAQGRPHEAWADASLAFATRPEIAFARIRDRAALAMGDGLEVWPTSPEAFDEFPSAGLSLVADLKFAADRFQIPAQVGGRVEFAHQLTRVVLLSAAREHSIALAEADWLVVEAPWSLDVRLLQAKVRRRASEPDLALEDVASGLRSNPDDPRFYELRGLIRVESGDFEAGLADLAVAVDRGASSARGPAMAKAFAALGRHAEAAALWSEIIDANPHDIQAHLGLAHAHRRLGEWDRSMASLEEAAALAQPSVAHSRQVALAYAACLSARPDRLPRVATLVRRLVEEWGSNQRN